MKTLSSRGLAYLYRYPSGKKEVLKRLDEAQNTFFRGRGSSSTLVELNVRAFERIYPMPKFSDPNRFRLHPQYEEDLNRFRIWYWSSVENLLKAAIRKLIDARQELLYSGNVNEQEIIQLLDWLRELKKPFKDSTVASNIAEKWRALRNQNILEGINRTSFFEKRLRSIEDFVDEGGKKHRAFYYLSKKLSYEDLLIFHINYISVSTEDKTKLLARLIYSKLENINESIKELQEQLTSSQYRYFEPLLKLVVAKMFPDVYQQKELRRLCHEISQERIKKTIADWTSDFNLILPILFGATVAVAPVLTPLFLALELGGLLFEAYKRIEEQERVTAINDLQKFQIIDEAIVKKQDENPERSLITGIMTDILLGGIFKLGSKVGAKLSSQRQINDFIAEWGDDLAPDVGKKIVAKKSERGAIDMSRGNNNKRNLDDLRKELVEKLTLKRRRKTPLSRDELNRILDNKSSVNLSQNQLAKLKAITKANSKKEIKRKLRDPDVFKETISFRTELTRHPDFVHFDSSAIDALGKMNSSDLMELLEEARKGDRIQLQGAIYEKIMVNHPLILREQRTMANSVQRVNEILKAKGLNLFDENSLQFIALARDGNGKLATDGLFVAFTNKVPQKVLILNFLESKSVSNAEKLITQVPQVIKRFKERGIKFSINETDYLLSKNQVSFLTDYGIDQKVVTVIPSGARMESRRKGISEALNQINGIKNTTILNPISQSSMDNLLDAFLDLIN